MINEVRTAKYLAFVLDDYYYNRHSVAKGVTAPYLCCSARYFHTTVVENEVLPVFVAFN